jgi:putative transposase
VREWPGCVGVRIVFIEPGSPWEKGCVEPFIGKFRDKLLNGELFATPLYASVATETWRREYIRKRPHGSLGYRPPAPMAVRVENLTLGGV